MFSDYFGVSNIEKEDMLVLEKSCEYLIKKDKDTRIDPNAFFNGEALIDLNHAEIEDCLSILEKNGCVELERFNGGPKGQYSFDYRVTTDGFCTYAKKYIDGYEGILEETAKLIVNENIKELNVIAQKNGVSDFIMDFILRSLEDSGFLKLRDTIGSPISVYEVEPELRRYVKDL